MRQSIALVVALSAAFAGSGCNSETVQTVASGSGLVPNSMISAPEAAPSPAPTNGLHLLNGGVVNNSEVGAIGATLLHSTPAYVDACKSGGCSIAVSGYTGDISSMTVYTQYGSANITFPKSDGVSVFGQVPSVAVVGLTARSGEIGGGGAVPMYETDTVLFSDGVTLLVYTLHTSSLASPTVDPPLTFGKLSRKATANTKFTSPTSSSKATYVILSTAVCVDYTTGSTATVDACN